MNIDVPLRRLGTVDSGPLARTIRSASEPQWRENQYRQRAFDVHADTQSLILLTADVSHWPRLTVSRAAGWGLLAAQAEPLIRQIIASHYPGGGAVIRSMAARLPPGSSIKPHVDTHPSFRCSHRVHIPIASDARVRFTIDGRPYQLRCPEVYEINNQAVHSVMNRGTKDRINFIFDYIPPSFLDEITVQYDF